MKKNFTGLRIVIIIIVATLLAIGLLLLDFGFVKIAGAIGCYLAVALLLLRGRLWIDHNGL